MTARLKWPCRCATHIFYKTRRVIKTYYDDDDDDDDDDDGDGNTIAQ